MHLLYDQLMIMYAIVELFLHATEHFLRCLDFSLFSSISLSA
jgi:hypothetical protein